MRSGPRAGAIELLLGVRYGWGVRGRFRVLGCGWALLGALTLAACSPSTPPRWAEGGAPLALGAARWERDSGGPVELRPDGHVLVDGDLAFVIDRVGRVANNDYDAYAAKHAVRSGSVA